MQRKSKWWLSMGVAAATVALVYISPAAASHTGGDVTLLDKNGDPVAGTMNPYSPKATCGQCHNYGSSVDNSGDSMTGPGDDVMDKDVAKQIGVVAADGTVYFQTYTVKAYSHGISVGRHMNEGRNEEYTADTRAALKDPFFTNSTGMWGKY